MMRLKLTLFTLILVAFLVSSGLAQKTATTITKPGDVLGENLGWMDISSTEHTGEYLAKTGGATGSATAYSMYDVRGNWSMELRNLNDKIVGSMRLTLTQIGTIVFGAGTMPVEGSNQLITANGAITEGTMSLAVVSYPQLTLFQMRLPISDNRTDGNFDAYSSAGGVPLQGRVIGEKDVARTLS
ncbi:MAG: hypothetical protein A4E45_01547 [Methanosaeta sp. PtaB.Bin039]|nr:MAG: hypothetical protein A4E45_01547 [Methanosaeta sp. PtaB.Bin039]OPY46821.1 MAG: hypothetical protein A4E47_00471 [Methanosaeta sp. PtaU1.Bin028]HQF16916.1 hypothetical protein [Methanotrichaceae archaeon]HQI91483.1 hypothetical protein [Methanotrichaceae archaeon]HQJ28821.1 hypothetical protein [Methanotrichaceae archaeon]